MRFFATMGLVGLLVACGDPSTTKDDDASTSDTQTPATTDTGDTDTGMPTDTGTPDTGTPSLPTQPVVRDPRFDPVVDVLLKELGPNLATGVSVAVTEGGVLTWAEGFGTADPDGMVPVTPDTVFQIGSTTKQMTAAVALQAVEDGSLSLDDTVAQLLPSVSFAIDPSWAPAATLDLLLSHQGGSYDFIEWDGSPDDEELALWHEGFFSQSLWPMSPPGSFWNYSNPNFTIPGLAVETHDPGGRAFADILTEDLFEPLGMYTTYARKAPVEAAGRHALSVGVDGLADVTFGTVPMADIDDAAAVRPAGLVWSTPTDMTRWGAFLLDGDPAILSDALRTELITGQVSTLYHDDLMQYGYGIFAWDQWPMLDGSWYPIRVLEHGGNTLSFTSVFLALPEHDVVISILSNGYGDLYPQTTEALLRTVVDPFPASTGRTPTFDPALIGDHVGSYEDFNLGPIEITAGGTFGLQISMPILELLGYTVSADLAPASTDVWYMTIDGIDLDLVFVRDPGGGASPWVRNRAFVGARVGPGTPQALHQLASVEAIEAILEQNRRPSPTRVPQLRLP